MLPRHSLSDDLQGFFKKNGYVILRDLFDEEELTRARMDIFSLFETRFDALNTARLTEYSLLTEFYRTENEKWRQCAARMFDLLSIYRLAAKTTVNELMGKLGLRKPMISTRPEVRTDMPEDAHYMQPWHQDWRYGQGSLNSATIWIPLHDVSVENGTIDVVPGSHLLGYVEAQEISNPRRFSIDESRIQDFESFPVELELGEAVAFSQMIVHRSGYNRTKLPRLTTQLRFVDYSEPSFVANGLPNPPGSGMLWDPPPTSEEMATVYGTEG